MPMGKSRRGFRHFLGGGRDGVETDEGEENHRRPRLNPRPAVGGKRTPVLRLHVPQADDNEKRQHHQLDAHHRGVEPALSLMPATNTTVIAVTMKTAGRLNTTGTPSSFGAS